MATNIQAKWLLPLIEINKKKKEIKHNPKSLWILKSEQYEFYFTHFNCHKIFPRQDFSISIISCWSHMSIPHSSSKYPASNFFQDSDYWNILSRGSRGAYWVNAFKHGLRDYLDLSNSIIMYVIKKKDFLCNLNVVPKWYLYRICYKSTLIQT